MKNIILTSGIVLAAALSIAGCSKEPNAPLASEGAPFEISTVLTRTANDGVHTSWTANDSISLCHAVTGTADYKSDGKFTVDAALEGKFSGTLCETLDPAKSYDWFALYPYNSALSSASAAGSVTVGGLKQTQTGNGSSAHLSGAACPLFGVAAAVAADATPSLMMKNLASLLCVIVTNSGTSPLTVKSVSFTSSEDIVGTYSLDCSGSVPVYTKSGEAEVSSTAVLNVKNGEAIAAGESAKFYLAIKPHTAPAGTALKLSVNGTEKSITLTSERVFEAGKIADASIAVKGYALLDIVENGVLFWISDDGKTGKVMAGPRGEGKAYSTNQTTTGATDADDGTKNVATLKGIDPSLDKYPAAQYCDNLSSTVAGDWYLPASEELKSIFKTYNGTSTVDKATSANPNDITDAEKAARAAFDTAVASLTGGVALNTQAGDKSGDSAFASTETSQKNAFYLRFGKRLASNAAKTSTARTARCIKVVDLK